jgi:hypothetical protein
MSLKSDIPIAKLKKNISPDGDQIQAELFAVRKYYLIS